ncbi:hypothetical protein EJ04DRAFT_575350 [Polyplosphaeria fusca]|uniref:Ribosome biogenesis protein Alb1 n=1 Tax=Polyplosphaeria fusca TaxID=682080 RepID=A0A9P4V4N5_9PLEO|nr:hypothetical protein EJ04DRAFT_575350 [Polyplosphaeria fusca]
MAKTAKTKKRQTSIHSRAARRASPSLEIPKSSKPTPRTTSPTATKPHVLAAHSSGITKSKSKPIKRQKRLRQLKSIEKAADALDKLEVKVQRSVGNEKKGRGRKKGWDEVNEVKRKKGFEVLGEEGEEGEEGGGREWVSDEEMDGAEANGMAVMPEVSGEVKDVVVMPANVPLPAEQEDELL